MPVRTTNRGHGGLTGYLARLPMPSQGTRHHEAGFIQFESALEKDLFTVLRYLQHVTREVRWFEEQPLRIDYLGAAGEPRHYTPDALVHYPRGRVTELIEVKYRADLRLHLNDWRPKFQAARALCEARGWVFRVRTEHSIRTPLLDHASFFPPFLGRAHDPDDTRLVLDEVQRQGVSTPRAILDALSPLVPQTLQTQTLLTGLDPHATRRAALLSVLWTLVAHGFVLLDVSCPPSLASVLRPVGY